MNIPNLVEEKMITIKNQLVLIDSDVAELYGVETKRINEAVKNNPDKFPNDYIITLTAKDKQEVVENFDHLQSLKFSPNLPKAFTEKGLYMLATILKSKQATTTTLAIIETYAKIKNLSRTINQLSVTKNEAEQKELMKQSGNIFAEVLEDNWKTDATETTIELNFAVLKLKHTIKRKNEK